MGQWITGSSCDARGASVCSQEEPRAPQSALRRSRGRLSLLTGGAVGAKTGRSGGEVLWRQRSTVGLHEWGVVGLRVGGDRILISEVGSSIGL